MLHGRNPRVTALALVLVVAATTAYAADRTPADRQTLTDLAYVLGQSHALRQACQGQTDQFWRQRMYRLIQTEQPDQGFDRSLKQAFNAGYAAAQAANPACTPQSRRAEAKAAEHGRALVGTLEEAQ